MNMLVSAKRDPEDKKSVLVDGSPQLSEGVISSQGDGCNTWELVDGRIAERAVSCLVDPELGDGVVVFGSERRHMILAILTRENNLSVAIGAGKAQGLILKGKNIRLQASHAAEITSLGSLTFSAPLGRIQITAAELFQSISCTLVTLARNMVTKVTDYQFRGEGSVVSTAKTQVITAETDLRIDAQRINMG